LLLVPSISVPPRCHPNPIRRFARTSQSNATRRRAGGGPAPLQIGELETGFIRTARDQRALPDRNAVSHLAEFHAAMPTLCLDAAASTKSPLVRAASKSIPPRNAGALGGKLQQRSGVQMQFWSVVFTRDSLLQVNRNSLGRASTYDAIRSRLSPFDELIERLRRARQRPRRRGAIRKSAMARPGPFRVEDRKLREFMGGCSMLLFAVTPSR
jgi:hypothetical protein